MRAVALVIFASLFSVGVTAPVIAKNVKKPAAPVSTVKASIESERVELDVRQPGLPDAEPEPEPVVKKDPPKKVEPPKEEVKDEPPPFAVMVASRIDELPMCRRGEASGPGMAEVLFTPEGTAKVSMSEPYARTETGACVARRLGRDARPYEGKPVLVRVRFSL